MTEALDRSILFQSIQVGRMLLRNRIMLPPHGRLVGDLFGSPDQAERQLAYWRTRAEDGAGWICGLSGFVGNAVMIPGFEPTGLGATRRGVFRLPQFRERARRYADAVHDAGAYASAQLIMQGGMPHSPSGVLANYTNNQVPHILTAEEIEWFVEEYAFSAAEAKQAGLDGIELHANHEDLLQLFLSPATNHRDDAYGGDMERRCRFPLDILRRIRQAVGGEFTVGVRLNMDEFVESGYGLDEGVRIAQLLAGSTLIDYLHCVIGNNWGAPSYIQPHHYRRAQWAPMAARFRQGLDIPVVYTGRIATVADAHEVLTSGYADVVGMARAMFADGELISKARGGRVMDIRPCIGTNDCLHRVTVEGLRFGCSVNPATGRESERPVEPAPRRKRVLVAGGGPAGLELACLLAERTHQVELWEREAELGGQLLVAARASENAAYLEYIAFQARRLDALGVCVRLGCEATPETVGRAAPDVLAVATGARPRRPPVDGIDLPHVLEGRDVLLGRVPVGERIIVIAMEDREQPLTIAGYLADLGKHVTVIYPTPGIASLVGRYSLGAALAKIAAADGEVIVMERVVSVDEDRLVTRNVFSGTPREYRGFDNVVLACGGTSESSLFTAMREQIRQVHLLGDAYAPRRISFATRQAYELARLI